MRLAVQFHRLGPYHHARLQALAARQEVVALELSSTDQTYKWDRVIGDGSFRRVTLFKNNDSALVPKRQVVTAVFDGLDSINPDCVAIAGWADKGALACLLWCVHRDKPAILMCASSERDLKRKFLKESIKKFILQSFSSAIVGGTPHKDYVSRLGIPLDRIFLGYDAVDNDHFSTNASRACEDANLYRATYGLPRQYFLSSNRFLPRKNIVTILNAYACYRESVENPWGLVLLGDGEEMPAISDCIRRLRLGDCVLLPGFRQYNELPVYYGLASCYIQASLSEQWGLVVNEAMASGLPVLVSDVCGCADDLVNPGENGFVFSPMDSRDLAGKMIKIATACDCEAMGKRSQEIVSLWGCENFATNMIAAAEVALGSPRKNGLCSNAALRLFLRFI